MNSDSNILLEEERRIGDDGQKESSMFSFQYYQRFFQVSTDQVVKRLVWSMVPRPGTDFSRDLIQSNPDLYGPVWISLTLIFTVTISGNLGRYLSCAESGSTCKYDFHLISLAATCVLSYCWILPLALWACIKWSSSDEIKVSYLDLTCIYGYCITIFVPVSILWLIQIKWFQWFLACIASLLSGTVLFKSLLPIIRSKKYLFLFTLLSCHFLLALSLLWNFFQSTSSKFILNHGLSTSSP